MRVPLIRVDGNIAYNMLYLIVRGSRRLSDMYTGAEIHALPALRTAIRRLISIRYRVTKNE